PLYRFVRHVGPLSSSRRLAKKVVDFRIQVPSDSESVRVSVGGQKTGHPVIRQMHAVRPLIYQNCDRSVRSGIGNMLCHFFHDNRIPDQKAHDFRPVEPSLLTQNRAEIEFNKHHQPPPAQTSVYCSLQFSEGPCALGCLLDPDHIRLPNGRFESRHDHLKRLGRWHTEPFDLDLSDRHLFLLIVEANHATVTLASRHRGDRIRDGTLRPNSERRSLGSGSPASGLDSYAST